MTRNKKILIGALVLATVSAAAVAATAARGQWGHHGGRHMGMGMMGAACRGNPAEMADLMLVRLEYKVKPTDAQKSAFDSLKSAARTAAAKLQAGCPVRPERTAEGTPPPRKAPTERLAMMETSLAAQLNAIRTVRPAADAFYATLSDMQKAAFTMGEGRRGGWRHRDGEHGEYGGRGERGERGEGGMGRRGDRETAPPSGNEPR